MHTNKWTPTSHQAIAGLTKHIDQLLLMDCTLQITKHTKIQTHKNCCKYPKVETALFYYRLIGLNNADNMSKSVDPDQTAPVCSDLFVQKTGSLRYKGPAEFKIQKM